MFPNDTVLISFVASSLFHDGWPIEVGLAAIEEEKPVVWSSLIRRHESWPITGWSFASQEQHQVSLEDLAEATGATDVVSRIIATINGRRVVSASPVLDRKCLNRLFEAAQKPSVVDLIDWEVITREMFPADALDDIFRRRDASFSERRAGPALERLLSAWKSDVTAVSAQDSLADLSLPLPFGAPHQPNVC